MSDRAQRVRAVSDDAGYLLAMDCNVIRCTQPSAGVFNVGPPEGFPIDAAVCEEHWARLLRDEPWSFDSEEKVLLMGKDLERAGLRLITKVTGWSESDGQPSGSVQLDLEFDGGEPTRILVTHEVLASLLGDVGLQGLARSAE